MRYPPLYHGEDPANDPPIGWAITCARCDRVNDLAVVGDVLLCSWHRL